MCVRICAKLDISAGAGVVQAVVDNPMLPAVGGSATSAPRESPGAVSIVACGPVALVGQARQLACARGYDFRSEDFHF